MGINGADLGFSVAALTDGAFIDEYFRGDDKIDIFLFSQAGSDQRLDRIDQMPVHVPDVGVVPLASLVDVVETVDTDAIRRLNGRRTVTLNIIPPRSVALETALGEVQSEVVDWLAREGHLSNGMSVDRTLHYLREGASDAVAAVREAVATRIRPIMMSMITTLFGLAPLVFIPGEGTEMYRGVGVVVLAGPLFATLVTLTFLPALLVTLLKFKERRLNGTGGPAPSTAAAARSAPEPRNASFTG